MRRLYIFKYRQRARPAFFVNEMINDHAIAVVYRSALVYSTMWRARTRTH